MNKTDLISDRSILNDFLKMWPLEKVRQMTLDEYVNVKNTETFCQYVETKTRSLGSIKGLPGSIKFGIYKRKNPKKPKKNAISDDIHTWLPYYGTDIDEVFVKIKQDLINTIVSIQKLDYEKIDNIHLPNIFKWKVAFLYSNEGFIPIYKKDALHLIAASLGLKINNKTKYSEIHRYIAKSKPFGISVFDYMRTLYSEYKIDKQEKIIRTSLRRKKRKGTFEKNRQSQHRKGTSEYVAEQFHNELQEELKRILIEKYGPPNVVLEENYVDVKVLQPNEIQYYEVKTAGYAEDCIIQAIGQLLSYINFEHDTRNKKMIVFGKNDPTLFEREFIEFIKGLFKDISFEYLSLNDLIKIKPSP